MHTQPVAIASLVLLATLSCAINPGAEPEIGPQATPFGPPAGSGFGFTWPESIPDDIPILEGEIQMVMEAPGSHIRIFYQNLAQDQLERYLNLLEQEGFELEYIVYTREGFPDKSEEKHQRGDYDAIDITKGQYHMRIEHGSDITTYDIYTSGFQSSTP